MDISIVIPAYNEEGSVKELHNKLTKVLSNITSKYEIIFIDDGSTDRTLRQLLKIRNVDRHVKVLAFERNFGKSYALTAGFKIAEGELVFTMDADLQDDPKEIPRFISKINEGYDLITGWKFVRYDPVSKTLPSKFFNRLTSWFTGANVHDSNCGYKVYKKAVIKQLRLRSGFHRYIPAILQWHGFKIGEIKVTHHPRAHGSSKYGSERLIRGMLDLLALKSIYPNSKKSRYIFNPISLLAGMMCIILGTCIVIFNIINGIGQNWVLPLILSSIFILIGLQLFSVNILSKMLLTAKKDARQYVLKNV